MKTSRRISLNTSLKFFAISVVSTFYAGSLFGAEWKVPENAPLLTRWARDVSPSNALSDYPRPQMVREQWQNLNGLWDYAITSKGRGEDFREVGRQDPRALSDRVGAVGRDETLLAQGAAMVPPHVQHCLKRGAGQRILLHFGAVDWEAAVYVNGRDLGGHRGGYDAFTLDITRALRSGETQEVVVSVLDPSDESWHLHGKQTLHPGGCSYTASSGIWQTVWLEPVPMTTSIETLHAVPDLQAGVLKLTVAGRVGNEPLTLVATALDGEKQVAQAAGKAGFDLWPALRENKVHFYKNTGSWFTTDLELPIKDAKLWTPDAPFLYDLKVEMHDLASQVF